jgi:GT2 family glycosyltransferase
LQASSALEVSVVIVTYNRCRELVDAIETISASAGCSFEIIVFDNGSDDETVSQVNRRFPNVVLMESDKNQGTCVTRNEAVGRSNGKYVWFLDSDVTVRDPEHMARLVEFMESNPSVGVVGGEAVVDLAGEVVGTKTLTLLSNGSTEGTRRVESGFPEPLESQAMATCNFFISRRLFDQVGGFDPWYFFYLEDLDLSYRIHKAGYRLVSFSKTPVVHEFSETQRVPDYFHIARNRIYFVIKNMPLRTVLLLPIWDLVTVFRLSNFGRLLRLIRLHGLGKRATTIADTQASLAVSGSGVIHALRTALTSLFVLFSGYLLALPYLHKALAVRKQQNSKA